MSKFVELSEIRVIIPEIIYEPQEYIASLEEGETPTQDGFRKWVLMFSDDDVRAVSDVYEFETGSPELYEL